MTGEHTLNGTSGLVPSKRPRSDDAVETSVKKAKTAADGDDDIVVLDNHSGGAIVIDDD